jgi:hypothetical protein
MKGKNIPIEMKRQRKLGRRAFASLLVGAAIISSSILSAQSAQATLGAWGGYDNGKIPVEALSVVDYPGVSPTPPSMNPMRLQPEAAAGFLALLTAYHNATGGYLSVDEGYRDYDTQVYWKNYWTAQGQPGNASAPGTSNHGWGTAVDFVQSDVTFGSAKRAWLLANAGAYGYSPLASEAWHWNFTGTYAGGTPSAPVLPGGTVVQTVAGVGTGWQSIPTSQSVNSGMISTVNMGGNWPQIWVNEGGSLVEIWGDAAGWHKVPTGIQINPKSVISAIRVANEPNARIYINEGGTLLEAYGDSAGWHVGNTGLQIGTGQISATYLSGGWGRIMVNESGVLMEVSADSTGWHKGNTGIQIGNAYISAVNMGNNRLQIMANDGGTLFQISPYGGAWHKDSTGLQIGSGYISAVNMDGTWPQVAINGGGTLLFAVGTSSGWVLQSTGKAIGPGLVPAVNMRPGVTTNNWPSVISLQ